MAAAVIATVIAIGEASASHQRVAGIASHESRPESLGKHSGKFEQPDIQIKLLRAPAGCCKDHGDDLHECQPSRPIKSCSLGNGANNCSLPECIPGQQQVFRFLDARQSVEPAEATATDPPDGLAPFNFNYTQSLGASINTVDRMDAERKR